MLDKYKKIIQDNDISVFCLALSKCSTCLEWIPLVLEPFCKENNIPLEIVYTDIEKDIVFIPQYSPTTYFFSKKHEGFPMILSGPIFYEELYKNFKLYTE